MVMLTDTVRSRIIQDKGIKVLIILTIWVLNQKRVTQALKGLRSYGQRAGESKKMEKFAGILDCSVKVSVIEYTKTQRVRGPGRVRYGSSGHCSS